MNTSSDKKQKKLLTQNQENIELGLLKKQCLMNGVENLKSKYKIKEHFIPSSIKNRSREFWVQIWKVVKENQISSHLKKRKRNQYYSISTHPISWCTTGVEIKIQCTHYNIHSQHKPCFTTLDCVLLGSTQFCKCPGGSCFTFYTDCSVKDCCCDRAHVSFNVGGEQLIGLIQHVKVITQNDANFKRRYTVFELNYFV
ncbi:hypothetical protein ACTFIV_002508 [Dictyostelium citrinum]